MPRKPRAKRAPRGPRVRTRHKGKQLYGIWNARCKGCKAKFRVYGLEPKLCITCKSTNLEINPGRMNAQEKAEQDARFAHAAVRMIFTFMNAFGIPFQEYAPPPPPPTRPASMSRYEAALFIASYSATPKDYILDSSEACEQAYRRAARELHPDAGGSHEQFVKLQQAKAVLDAR